MVIDLAANFLEASIIMISNQQHLSIAMHSKGHGKPRSGIRGTADVRMP